jgi:hypothetical protein
VRQKSGRKLATLDAAITALAMAGVVLMHHPSHEPMKSAWRTIGTMPSVAGEHTVISCHGFLMRCCTPMRKSVRHGPMLIDGPELPARTPE